MQGFLQPFTDIVKLFSKEYYILNEVQSIIYYFIPLLRLFLTLISWSLWSIPNKSLRYNLIGYIVIIAFSSYILLFLGVRRKSIYSFIGRIRGISQIIAYEVSFMIRFFILIFSVNSFSFFNLKNSVINYPIIIILILFISGISELNRRPFDFSEGESELVSGFNTEYWRIRFSFIFLSEYAMIILFCYLMGAIINLITLGFFILFLFLILIIRRSFPRLRYDTIIYLTWLKLIPFSCIIFLIII